MNTAYASLFAWLMVLAAPLAAQENKPAGKLANSQVRRGDKWAQVIEDRAQRGTLHDAFQLVRGDTGRWSDEPQLLHAPATAAKPLPLKLDDWADRRLDAEATSTAADDNWLLVRTRQLDDNDRLWIERVERQGNEFTVVLSEAIWQGRYQKTFTYYGVFGVNLGQLKAGEYQARCTIQPLSFKQFDGDGRPLPENRPKDDRPAEKKPVELRTTFRVGAK